MMPDALSKILWIGVGGFLGANARFWLGVWVQSRWGTAFPWGTLVINVSGSFVLGLVLAGLAQREDAGAYAMRLLMAVGFLGAYTTFSTFEWETLALLAEGQYLRALGYATGSLAVGLVAVWIGAALGRAIAG
jgi:fluoride exporter